jgi:hypothetical protein
MDNAIELKLLSAKRPSIEKVMVELSEEIILVKFPTLW